MKSKANIGVIVGKECDNCFLTLLHQPNGDVVISPSCDISNFTDIVWEARLMTQTENDWALLDGGNNGALSYTNGCSFCYVRVKYKVNGCEKTTSPISVIEKLTLSLETDCYPGVTQPLGEESCGVGSYKGYRIDTGCSCGISNKITVTSNIPVTEFSIDYLGGILKPNIISQTDTQIVFDHIAVTPSNFMYNPCPNTVATVDSLYHITAKNVYGQETIKIISYQC